MAEAAVKNGAATLKVRELSTQYLQAKNKVDRIRDKIAVATKSLKKQLEKAEEIQADLKDTITEAAVASGRKRINCDKCLINVMQGRAAVKVVSIDALPDEFITRTAKKKELLAALKELGKGETIPGAKLTTGNPFITVEEFDV